MEIDYNIEKNLDWSNAQSIGLKINGWKYIFIEYIDMKPYVIWRVRNTCGHFRSNASTLMENGATNHFATTLITLKQTITNNYESMTQDDKDFYTKHFMDLFE
jgi:hypothetical protein